MAKKKTKVKTKDLQKRKTGAFLRQGEWFFIPKPNLKLSKSLILRNEPIQRGAGTPHMVQELYRIGGRTLYTCPKFPNGLLEYERKEAIEKEPELGKEFWRARRIGARVYGRGRVTHQDHRTISLQFWHEILMNTEVRARAMRNVSFID